jgi:hypothetical protein
MARAVMLLAFLAFLIPCPAWAGDEGLPFPLTTMFGAKEKELVNNWIKTIEYIGDAYVEALDKYQLYYGKFDFNNDGIDEIVIINSYHINCGTAGCLSHIFKIENNKLVEICGIHMHKGTARIFLKKINGYRTFSNGEYNYYFDENGECKSDEEEDGEWLIMIKELNMFARYRSKDKNGYDFSHPFSKALGRYRFTPEMLRHMKWLGKDKWTKAATKHGIESAEDFLASPEAQEVALGGYMRMLEREMDKLDLYRHVGATYIGSLEGKITITESGLSAAAFYAGVERLRDYLERRSTIVDTKGHYLSDRELAIEKLIREFASESYARGKW